VRGSFFRLNREGRNLMKIIAGAVFAAGLLD